MANSVRVAIVGLEFVAEFIPIYQAHPGAEMRAICQRTRAHLDEVGDAFGVESRYTDYAELLKDPDIDAVHVNTPPMAHADHVVAGLRAGKHVACTIPMALRVEDCKRIVDAAAESGRKYMMMETVVYSREFLYVKSLYDSGEMGRVQFYRSSHQQDMTGWPSYWEGFPPMWNATHAVSPTLALRRDVAEWVQCAGSGRIQEDMIDQYASPFAIESTHIKFRDTDVFAEVTRSLFETARQYRESFDVFASKKSFEWTQSVSPCRISRIDCPPRSAGSRPAASTTRTNTRTAPSSRGADTADRTPTLPMSSSPRSPKIANRIPTPPRPRTSPAPASSRMNPRCAVVRE